MKVALVLWDGNVGGAEKVTAELAGALRARGVEASILFVRDPGALAADLDRIRRPGARPGPVCRGPGSDRRAVRELRHATRAGGAAAPARARAPRQGARPGRRP